MYPLEYPRLSPVHTSVGPHVLVVSAVAGAADDVDGAGGVDHRRVPLSASPFRLEGATRPRDTCGKPVRTTPNRKHATLVVKLLRTRVTPEATHRVTDDTDAKRTCGRPGAAGCSINTSGPRRATTVPTHTHVGSEAHARMHIPTITLQKTHECLPAEMQGHKRTHSAADLQKAPPRCLCARVHCTSVDG